MCFLLPLFELLDLLNSGGGDFRGNCVKEIPFVSRIIFFLTSGADSV